LKDVAVIIEDNITKLHSGGITSVFYPEPAALHALSEQSVEGMMEAEIYRTNKS
jgi:hypothetical protein